MRVTFTPYYRKRGKDAKCGAVYIRVTVERLHIYRPVFLYPTEKEWNAKAKKIRCAVENSEQSNALITQSLAETEKMYMEHRLQGGVVSYAELKKVYSKPEGAKRLLSEVVEEYLRMNNFAADTAKHLRSFVTMSGKWGLPAEITATTPEHGGIFIKTLAAMNYKPNSIAGYIKRAKTIFNYAYQKGYIKSNPLDEIKRAKFQSNKKFLDLADLKLIESCLAGLSMELQNVARLFLFSCFTGLRFSDLFCVNRESIITAADGPALNYVQQKTKSQRVLPLLPQAVALIPIIDWKPLTNQYYNRSLKEIATAAGISKVLTSHVARHTFATIGLNKGIRMEVMQQYLGHDKIETTKGYAHLHTATVARELQTWNE